MNHATLSFTKPGTTLVLKTARALAYGRSDTRVTYVEMRPRQGYKTPFVVAHDLDKPLRRDVYRLSDFRGLE